MSAIYRMYDGLLIDLTKITAIGEIMPENYLGEPERFAVWFRHPEPMIFNRKKNNAPYDPFDPKKFEGLDEYGKRAAIVAHREGILEKSMVELAAHIRQVREDLIAAWTRTVDG